MSNILYILILSSSFLASASDIYITTEGVSYRYLQNHLEKISIKSKTVTNKTAAAMPVHNLDNTSKIFQNSLTKGCHSIDSEKHGFQPYKDFEHFSRYFYFLKYKHGEIFFKNSVSKPEMVTVYQPKNNSVCSSGVTQYPVILHTTENIMYFSSCENENCNIFQLELTQNILKKIVHIDSEVVDIGIDRVKNHLLILSRKKTDSDSDSLFAIAGHPREKYSLFLSSIDRNSGELVQKTIAEHMVNPDFWIDQQWLIE